MNVLEHKREQQFCLRSRSSSGSEGGGSEKSSGSTDQQSPQNERRWRGHLLKDESPMEKEAMNVVRVIVFCIKFKNEKILCFSLKLCSLCSLFRKKVFVRFLGFRCCRQ